MANGTDTLDRISAEIESIHEDLAFIKEHMVDVDSILTEEDYAAVADSRAEKKQGKLTNLKDLKKELGM